MKFLELYLNHVLTLGAGVRISLADRGLNVIQGENLDNSSAVSNGSGKSSIVDGLCWVLFGITARGTKGDKVVNNKVKKPETMGTVTMINGASGYRVTRHRKHSVHKNQLHIEAFNPLETMIPGASGVRLDKGTEAESQKELEKILGCSYEVFRAAIYSGQEDMPDLPRMGDRDLKQMIEEAAGMSRIERAYQISRERMTGIKTAVSRCESMVDSAKTGIARADSGLAEQQGLRDAWEDGRGERVAESAGRVKLCEDAFKLAQDALAASAARQPALDAALVKLNAVLDGNTAVVRAAEAATVEFNRLDRLVDRTGATVASNKIKEIEANIAGAAAHMGKPCVECGKPHTEAELEGYLQIQNERLATAKTHAAAVVAKVREQMAAVAAQKAVAEKLASEIPDVSEVAKKQALVNDAKRQHTKIEQDVAAASRELKAATEQLELRRSQPNPYAAAVAALQAQHEKFSADLATHTAALAELNTKLATAESVVKVFGPAGVRAQILDTVTPYLNDRTADYLSVLSDGHAKAVWTTLTKSAAGDLKEKFSIEVCDDQGADDFTGLSGGEKRKVRLATALALQDLVASRATQPIELWIGDEIDDALDPAGLERLMTLLERKARERGTVLVISHNSLTDWCDQVTLVKKAGGVSSVSGALVE